MQRSWLGVELRHLAALAAVAKEGSFRGAADALGYVQSAVSQQVAQLEHLVDIRLVDRQRGPGPVSLTEAGELLLAHAETILARFEGARADLELLKQGRAGRLRIGLSEGVAAGILPRIVPPFRRRHAHFELETTETVTEVELPALVQSGEVDVAFCSLPIPGGPFESVALLDDPYLLVVPTGSPLAARSVPATPEGLSRLPLVDHALMRHVEAQLRPLGFEPRYVFRSEVHAAVQALVGAGVGAAILPRLAVDEHHPGTEMKPLDELLAPRVIAMIWNPERSDARGVRVFVDTVREVWPDGHDVAPRLHLAS